MRYSRPMRVRFGHADPAKIVYHPRFFEWFHLQAAMVDASLDAALEESRVL